MPLIHNLNDGKEAISTWEMSESVEELRRMVNLNDSDHSEFEKLPIERRKKEFLTVRILVSRMLDGYPVIRHDQRKKPFLENRDQKISISHSRILAAVIVSDHIAGIDTEETNRKVTGIAERFLSEKELSWTCGTENPNKAQIFCWSCKEAVYKMVDMPGMDFRINVQILPADLKQEGYTYAIFSREGTEKKLKVNYFFWKENVITWCISE